MLSTGSLYEYRLAIEMTRERYQNENRLNPTATSLRSAARLLALVVIEIVYRELWWRLRRWSRLTFPPSPPWVFQECIYWLLSTSLTDNAKRNIICHVDRYDSRIFEWLLPPHDNRKSLFSMIGTLYYYSYICFKLSSAFWNFNRCWRQLANTCQAHIVSTYESIFNLQFSSLLYDSSFILIEYCCTNFSIVGLDINIDFELCIKKDAVFQMFILVKPSYNSSHYFVIAYLCKRHNAHVWYI